MWNATLVWNGLSNILRQQSELLLSCHALKSLYLFSKSSECNFYVAAINFGLCLCLVYVCVCVCVCVCLDKWVLQKSQQKYTPLLIIEAVHDVLRQIVNVTPRRWTNFIVTCLIWNFRWEWSKLNHYMLYTWQFIDH